MESRPVLSRMVVEVENNPVGRIVVILMNLGIGALRNSSYSSMPQFLNSDILPKPLKFFCSIAQLFKFRIEMFFFKSYSI